MSDQHPNSLLRLQQHYNTSNSINVPSIYLKFGIVPKREHKPDGKSNSLLGNRLWSTSFVFLCSILHHQKYFSLHSGLWDDAAVILSYRLCGFALTGM